MSSPNTTPVTGFEMIRANQGDNPVWLSLDDVAKYLGARQEGLPTVLQSMGAGGVFENATRANMLPWNAAKGKLRSDGVNARLAFFTDSTGRGTGAGTLNTGNQLLTGAAPKSVPMRVGALLAAAGLPTITNSIFGFGGTQNIADAVSYDPRLSGFSGWGPGSTYSLGGIVFQTANTNPGIFTPDVPINRASIFSIKNNTRPPITVAKGSETFTIPTGPDATFRVSRDDVAFTTRDANAVSISRASGNSMLIAGAIFWDSTKPGVEIANFAVHNSTSGDLAALASGGSNVGPLSGLAAYAPHHTIVNLGANDLRLGIPLSTTIANLGAIVATAKASGSVTLVWHTTIGAAFGTPDVRAQWRDAIRALAYSTGCSFLDTEAYLGGQSALVPNGLIASDNVHLVAAAQDILGSAIAQGLA